MSDIQYVYPLIHNKVTSPHYVTPTLRRARLIDWLNGASECRAVVIAADAGYGKTTLLWQWEREVDFPCYWYKLDRNDRDWSLHISYLIESISQRHAGFGRRAHSMLEQLGGPGSSRPGVAAYLLAEMHERLTEPCTFIIDDWQFVASVTEVRGLWNQILRDAPPTCRFVFLSRAKPQLQFSRFKTHAGYAEMRTDALRFNDREIEELFRDIYNDPLDPTELAELERRTEGWAASLQLVEVSLRERRSPEDRRAFIQSITATTDSDLFIFLAEEVLDQQDERTRNFLLTTSIVQQITPDLAERLSGGNDGARMLANLEERGLFTYRLDSDHDRYRFHGLFRDFLERRLALERSPGEVVGLHIHAASYYETNREWPAAIHHYLRADLHPQAARLIARYGEEVASEGRLGLIDEWLERIPRRTIRENARLSLLYGEAQGIRGEWEAALAALRHARTYFTKKGDRRMEALAWLKLSTVMANYGRVTEAADAASEGLSLAPEDALATRLRLRGNLAITAGWLDTPFEELAHEFRRIVVEAKSKGWEHFAAIGLHNLGSAQRQMGLIRESVRSLEHAARYWNDLPASPFADSSEFVASLLSANEAGRAEAVATSAVIRTEPWPRPHAEARYGQALVFAYQGRHEEASEILYGILARPEHLGPTSELVAALLIECLFLSGGDRREIERVGNYVFKESRDPRLEPLLIPARAIVRHVRGCAGECLSEVSELRKWADRGATYVAAVALTKVAAPALEHAGKENVRLALRSVRGAISVRALRPLRFWLRRFNGATKQLARDSDGEGPLVALVDADPEGWRGSLLSALPIVSGRRRKVLLEATLRHATKNTDEQLRSISGRDVAELRRALVQRHAGRLFVRSFGSLLMHRGSWDGPTVPVEKRRTRTLLGLLVAHADSALTRDMVLDLMWPEAEPGAAVNSLNQTVFQLRRAIDPQYKDGESPQYVISTVDVVQFSPDLVTTDLSEFRRIVRDRAHWASHVCEAAQSLVSIVRGPFLSELRYEDWAARLQTAIHSEVRDVLLPLATGAHNLTSDLRIRAASALIELDEFDDDAYIALAEHLSRSGRSAAARAVIARYAQRVESELADTPSPAIEELRTRLAQHPSARSPS
ncbi:MAG TPA: hypothetical protein VHK63_08915 [Candidatus Limnocylindria bacterium]|nr:hypothetical protein [Candidatus Limnocylindria bacterium]